MRYVCHDIALAYSNEVITIMLQKTLALILGLTLTLTLIGCSEDETSVLTMATTTSTEDSGLLDELLPIFGDETGYEVDVITVGTGQALEIGRSGDADILLVHAKELEKEFVNDGYGTERFPVMYNDFVILGPTEDPAKVSEANDLDEAMSLIYQIGKEGDSTFSSRGDKSGTHVKETTLWEEFQLDIEGKEWYDSLGQGMGDTLIAANEMRAYSISDRGTFLSMEDSIENLQIVFEDDDMLTNPYGIIPVNPDTHENVNYEAANELVEFFVRDDIQQKISEFGIEEYGQPLFFPNTD
ncbi:extracellular solute-binding protein family 1 [Natranaerobius thermophilus JW/NM-WN-LF]|uniref:Extracellular solute-binding protein family 1 n=2 Tax=Natranaerobius TaxID=375928 RepID=B2A592_NATTJ|nr:extracellular solute-binding protein family 1 [Natranaerobius thermophilus JW/NM-WN-LF]